MKVREVMHAGVEWAHQDTPVFEIAKIMKECDIGAVPIGENGRLVGMVTDRDICCGIASAWFDPKETKARDVMSEGIHCCNAEDDIMDAVRHMEELKVRRLPVLDANKKMVGILSFGDLSQVATGRMLNEWAQHVAEHHASTSQISSLQSKGQTR